MVRRHGHWLVATLAVLLLVMCLLVAAPMIAARGPDGSHEVIFESYDHAPDLTPQLDEVASHVTQSLMPSRPVQAGKALTIIIDDIGHDLSAVGRLVSLPYPVTISVLPWAPFARQAAEMAHAAGLVVMLHMPMEPEKDHYRRPIGDDFLRQDMNEEEVRALLTEALSRVPYVQGINNHMGSALTSRRETMQWVMAFCREHGLFFVDSRTKASTVAADEARSAGLVWGERSVFLDHDPVGDAMQLAWNKALRKAQKSGAIVIGHPYAGTLSFLEEMIPEQEQNRITQVTDLLHEPAI